MRRSKYGYLLLALLVITGLAGTITPTSISGKERKFAVNCLKDTKNDILKSVKGLSDVQLRFRAAPGKWSIKEYTCHIATVEKNMWDLVQATLKQPANPEKRLEIKWTDAQLMKAMEDRADREKFRLFFDRENTSYKTVDEAMESFKITRANHIKYIKNTTEDLRNHVVQIPFGWVDCYQLCLMMSACSNLYTNQIEEIKATSNFPSR